MYYPRFITHPTHHLFHKNSHQTSRHPTNPPAHASGSCISIAATELSQGSWDEISQDRLQLLLHNSAFR